MRAQTSFLFILLLSGCVSVPPDKLLLIESSPSGIGVASSEGWTCVTPCERRVDYDSSLKLTLTGTNHQSTVVEVDVPPYKPSRSATYIGTGLGAITMALGADFIDSFNSALIEALTGSESDFLTSGEKLASVLAGGVIFGAIGYRIDRARDRKRTEESMRVHVQMVENGSTE